MRFAHLADCHIGGWREPKLKELSIKAFAKAINTCIEKKVDFVLISGDMFDTALPGIDTLKEVVINLKHLKDNNTPLYLIPGSHDFSPSGKTILDVLEKAGLLVNVAQTELMGENIKLNFTTDKNTKTKITGLLGRRGGMDKKDYQNLLKKELEEEPGFKVFMFHNMLEELRPKELEEVPSISLNSLPKNFNYYAGGHPHLVAKKKHENGFLAYPGPLFPNNFKEVEELENGGFYIVDEKDGELKLNWEPIIVANVFKLSIDAENKTTEKVEEEIIEDISNNEFINTIVTLRISGKLKSGKTSDIKFKEIFKTLYDKGAYFVMKNTAKLTSPEFEQVNVEKSSVEEIEESLIKENPPKTRLGEDDTRMIKQIMRVLSEEKKEGETKTVFEDRIKQEISNLLGLGL